MAPRERRDRQRPPADQENDDLAAFPVLVSPVDFEEGVGGSGGAVGNSESGTGMAQLVTSTLRQVLGWTPNPDDTKGFTGALTQSFDLILNEGHVDSVWKPRSFAVLTDLEGGVSGAQASVHTRAKDALERALPLLEGLYSLSLHADPEDTYAIKALIREHLTGLVAELGRLGGPRLARVDQLFEMLLGDAGTNTTGGNPGAPDADADTIGGELGTLRDELGLKLFNPRITGRQRDLINTVGEEENQTNYRILADYVISLHTTWRANRGFFLRGGSAQPFFGTQLVHLSRQLAVVAEQIRELRFAFSSVMIGPRERQTLQIIPGRLRPGRTMPLAAAQSEEELASTMEAAADNDADDVLHEPIFLEELLSWIDSFAREEGPRLVREGGKYGVQVAFYPTVQRLKLLVMGIRHPSHRRRLPNGYFHSRVRASLFELDKQLCTLLSIAAPLKHDPRGPSTRAAASAAK